MKSKRNALMFAAIAGAPIVGALTSAPVSAATAKAAKTYTYKGTTVSTTWGPMQVVISVKGKKITKVKVADPTHTTRSQVLSDRAIPILVQETLSAQSARIDTVSGATTLSQAYITSLQAALRSARLT